MKQFLKDGFDGFCTIIGYGVVSFALIFGGISGCHCACKVWKAGTQIPIEKVLPQ